MARAIVHAELREDVARYRRSEAVVTDQADAQCAQTDAVLRERDPRFDEALDFLRSQVGVGLARVPGDEGRRGSNHANH